MPRCAPACASEFAQRIAAAGITTVLVTHDEAEARAMAQRGFRLQGGRLEPLWEGTRPSG
jgi:ABC-type sulfate/molybdate transport systems ATPase subunit